MTGTDAVTPSDVWPCVGDGGGVAVTIDRCFSRIDSRIPANISQYLQCMDAWAHKTNSHVIDHFKKALRTANFEAALTFNRHS